MKPCYKHTFYCVNCNEEFSFESSEEGGANYTIYCPKCDTSNTEWLDTDDII